MKLPDDFCEYEYIDFVSKHIEMATSHRVSRDEHYEWLMNVGKFANGRYSEDNSDYCMRVIRETQRIARDFLRDLAQGKISVDDPD